MTGLYLDYLLLQSGDGLAIVAGSNRCHGSLQRTGFRDARDLHVFQKLRPDFRLLDELKNPLGLSFVDRSSRSIVIIPDDHDVENVAGDVPAKVRVSAPYRLHIRLATRHVRWGQHKGIFIMAARQVLQTAADHDPAILPRFVG